MQGVILLSETRITLSVGVIRSSAARNGRRADDSLIRTRETLKEER